MTGLSISLGSGTPSIPNLQASPENPHPGNPWKPLITGPNGREWIAFSCWVPPCPGCKIPGTWSCWCKVYTTPKYRWLYRKVRICQNHIMIQNVSHMNAFRPSVESIHQETKDLHQKNVNLCLAVPNPAILSAWHQSGYRFNVTGALLQYFKRWIFVVVLVAKLLLWHLDHLFSSGTESWTNVVAAFRLPWSQG